VVNHLSIIATVEGCNGCRAVTACLGSDAKDILIEYGRLHVEFEYTYSSDTHAFGDDRDKQEIDALHCETDEWEVMRRFSVVYVFIPKQEARSRR
jgi:hypothetical protein